MLKSTIKVIISIIREMEEFQGEKNKSDLFLVLDLLQSGADPRISDKHARTPLHVASTKLDAAIGKTTSLITFIIFNEFVSFLSQSFDRSRCRCQCSRLYRQYTVAFGVYQWSCWNCWCSSSCRCKFVFNGMSFDTVVTCSRSSSIDDERKTNDFIINSQSRNSRRKTKNKKSFFSLNFVLI